MNGAYFLWFDEECAEIMCACGKELMINIDKFKECPKCKKQYKLRQINEILERG